MLWWCARTSTNNVCTVVLAGRLPVTPLAPLRSSVVPPLSRNTSLVSRTTTRLPSSKTSAPPLAVLSLLSPSLLLLMSSRPVFRTVTLRTPSLDWTLSRISSRRKVSVVSSRDWLPRSLWYVFMHKRKLAVFWHEIGLYRSDPSWSSASPLLSNSFPSSIACWTNPRHKHILLDDSKSLNNLSFDRLLTALLFFLFPLPWRCLRERSTYYFVTYVRLQCKEVKKKNRILITLYALCFFSPWVIILKRSDTPDDDQVRIVIQPRQ